LFLWKAPLTAALALLAASTLGAPLRFEVALLTNDTPAITVHLLRQEPSTVAKCPVILMLGSLKSNEPPAWATNLIAEGYMLVAFSADHSPDSDPARRPQWLFFDQRFAHSYVLGGARTPKDTRRVIDYLAARPEVNGKKIGWLGSSSTGIPGLSVACREPRLAAIVAFVSTGAYDHWLATWHTNGLWRGATPELWPETVALLKQIDPVRHVQTMFPCAVLMVNGGEDKVVDAATARAFVKAAQPFYQRNPHRLRLVVYEGFGHNLPTDVVPMYAENWFRLYLHPTREPPPPAADPKAMTESVRRTQINAAEHQDVIRAK